MTSQIISNVNFLALEPEVPKSPTLKTHHYADLEAGVDQSVQCSTIDWTIEVLSPAGAKDFSSNLCVQTSPESHPLSYTKGTAGKVRAGREDDHSLHLFPRSKMSKKYIAPPPLAPTRW
jgi:hypothetical protein